MSVDCRSKPRSTATRRGCERLPVFERTHWRREDNGQWLPGLLISVSGAGLAMLTNLHDTPQPGSRIRLRLRGRPRPKPVEVIRVDHLSGTMDLIAAEFTSAP